LADINSLHQQMHDAHLLGGEEFIPERIKPLQCLAHVSFLDVAQALATNAE
jgi:hypothetical protein